MIGALNLVKAELSLLSLKCLLIKDSILLELELSSRLDFKIFANIGFIFRLADHKCSKVFPAFTLLFQRKTCRPPFFVLPTIIGLIAGDKKTTLASNPLI